MLVNVFSGDTRLKDFSDMVENAGPWFFAPLASQITSAGRLLLAMTEACVEEKEGTYLFCDTDSLAIVSSEKGGKLAIPGSAGVRILSWDEVHKIVDRFASLNPYEGRQEILSVFRQLSTAYVPRAIRPRSVSTRLAFRRRINLSSDTGNQVSLSLGRHNGHGLVVIKGELKNQILTAEMTGAMAISWV